MNRRRRNEPPGVPGSRPGASRAPDRAPVRPAPTPRPAIPALPLAHPAHIAALVIAAACVLFSVTFRITDTDLWQHLAVGRAMWTTHSIPQTQVWNWPGYGEPYVTPSWGFRALLWPFWAAGEVTGLFVWRWLTTLAAFALAWATARRMGARGLTTLLVLVVASLVYRPRSMVRPETLAAVLFALTIWILETRRTGGRDHTRWLIPIAWAWANIHISYPLAFVLLGIHHAGTALAARLAARRAGSTAARAGTDKAARSPLPPEGAARTATDPAAPPSAASPAAPPGAPAAAGGASLLRRDAVTALAMLAISFANPYGWRALAQPFEYFLFWRHEQIFRTVSELEAVAWRENLKNGLPLLVVGWPLLIFWRWRRGARDGVEALLAMYLIATALPTQRFLGTLALGAAPYLARDLDEWVRTRRWPAWTSPAWARALLAIVACAGAGVAEWSRPVFRQGVGLAMEWFPVRACDFIAAHGVRGRALNDFYLGGYLLWRFWPERDRLPFIDIHQTGTREDRRLAAGVTTNPAAWFELDDRHHFDWVLLNRYRIEGDRSQDALDADTSFAAVFMDDNAVLYVRRRGALAAVADSFAYRVVPAGPTAMRAFGASLAADPSRRAAAAAELERMTRESEFNSVAWGNLANLAMLEGRHADARAALERTLARDPGARLAWERLAFVALAEGRPRAALAALAREKEPERRELHGRLRGEALALERELESRRAELATALRREPARRDLADSLAAVERRLAR